MILPSLHGNWVDLVILLFLGFYIWDIHGKGFIRTAFELVIFVLTFVLALKLYPIGSTFLVNNFSFPKGLGNAASFFIIGMITEQVLSRAFFYIEEKIPNKYHLHKLNIWLTPVPAIGNAIVLLTFILMMIFGLPIKSEIKKAIADSKFSTYLLSKAQNLEKSLSLVFGEAFSDTLHFITITPGSIEVVKLHFTQSQTRVDEVCETDMLTLVNGERNKSGQKELILNEKLRDLARSYGREMFNEGFFSHYDLSGNSAFDRMNEAGVKFKVAGENLALAPSLMIAHQGLMDSPGHRANILSPDFRQIGIGCIDGGLYGKMFVQEFTD